MNKKNLKFVFWGTPDVASETLEILKQNGYMPSLIVTSPDAKRGRGLLMQASPVAVFAEKNKISCLKPEELKEGLDIGFKNNIQPELFIVVAYGKIIPENILNIPKLGSINIHYSLLPKYRGASPVESAILNGETETGVSLQKMKYKMDSGSVIMQEKVNILPDEKTPELRARLIKIGGELLVKILKTLTPPFPSPKEREKFKGKEQNENKATFCKKIKKEDGLIDLNDDSVKNYNKFRAYATWPRTFFFKNGKRIIITKARLENNQFVIEKIIPENGKEIDYKN